MNNKATLGLAVVAALGLALVGCGDDDGATGGMAGMGGAGGGVVGEGSVTAVHLAPEVPTAEDTEVEIYLNGDPSGATVEYSESTGRIALPTGTYDVGIGLPGADEPLLQLDGVAIAEGTDLTVVAYRTNDDLPVNVMVFNTSIDGLADGEGRVFVGHGANDPALNPVNIVTVDTPITECSDLVPGFVFGDIFPATGVVDLPETTLTVAFNVTEECPPVFADLGVDVPVTPNVASVVVAVDEDTTEGLAPQLWGMIDAGQPVPLIAP